MINQFSRTALLFGEDGIEKLKNSRVAVFGIGGVGGFVCEALVRSGVGHIDIIDSDRVCLTNLNRQIIALHSNIGRLKVDVMKERMLDISPECDVKTFATFFLPENKDIFEFEKYDYVVDAVDTVTAKLELVECCSKVKTPIISCMGAGNKIDPTKFEVTDVYKTVNDPLAKVMRRELKKRHINKLKVVYSPELPITPKEGNTKDEIMEKTTKRQTPGSNAFVPSVAGLIIAGEVIKDIVK